MSTVPTLLEVFIYNSDTRKPIILDCYRNFGKRGVCVYVCVGALSNACLTGSFPVEWHGLFVGG